MHAQTEITKEMGTDTKSFTRSVWPLEEGGGKGSAILTYRKKNHSTVGEKKVAAGVVFLER